MIRMDSYEHIKDALDQCGGVIITDSDDYGTILYEYGSNNSVVANIPQNGDWMLRKYWYSDGTIEETLWYPY